MSNSPDLVADIIKACSKLGHELRQVSCMNQKRLFDVQGINAYGERSLRIDLMLEEICLQFFKNIPHIRAVISEESGVVELGSGCYTVILDPLDGTKNFTMGLSYYACSLALLDESGEVVAAYVVNLANGHEYTAIRGCGAWRNELPIQTASHVALPPCDGIFVGLSKSDEELRAFKRVVTQLNSYRAMGCAALDLCCLAMGAAAVFVDLSRTAKLVDVLAAALILEEAGGRVTDSRGVPITRLPAQGALEDVTLRHKFLTIGAANPSLHDALTDTMQLQDPFFTRRNSIMFPMLTPFTSDEISGKLIVFDGVDGSGKTSMIERLAEQLRCEGREVLITMQPTPEMRELHIFKTFIYHPEKRPLVDYRALQLYMLADRMQHYKEVVEPALQAGAYVISDRYIYTMLATMVARGHSPEPWLIDLLPSIRLPHASFHMDVDLETCIARIKQRKSFEDSYVEREHLMKSLQSYRTVAELYRMHTVNSAELELDQAFAKITAIVEGL